jgi:hypothetical protein
MYSFSENRWLIRAATRVARKKPGQQGKGEGDAALDRWVGALGAAGAAPENTYACSRIAPR